MFVCGWVGIGLVMLFNKEKEQSKSIMPSWMMVNRTRAGALEEESWGSIGRKMRTSLSQSRPSGAGDALLLAHLIRLVL
jgi:hypothetical protein